MNESPAMRDEFLIEEDLDLRNLTDEELDRVWTAWLHQAQATNDQDEHTYSHGVFTHEPGRGGGGERIGMVECWRLLQNSVLQEPYSGFRIQDSE
jgi:hypothetical protein